MCEIVYINKLYKFKLVFGDDKLFELERYKKKLVIGVWWICCGGFKLVVFCIKIYLKLIISLFYY